MEETKVTDWKRYDMYLKKDDEWVFDSSKSKAQHIKKLTTLGHGTIYTFIGTRDRTLEELASVLRSAKVRIY